MNAVHQSFVVCNYSFDPDGKTRAIYDDDTDADDDQDEDGDYRVMFDCGCCTCYWLYLF